MNEETELRKVCKESLESITEFRTLADLKVSLLDCTRNPYKAMVNSAIQLFGNEGNKWTELTPEARFFVAKGVLEGKALPLAKEIPYFTFLIENSSRAAFDEIARARIATFSSMGTKDNDINRYAFIIPHPIDDIPELKEKVMDYVLLGKRLYTEIQRAGCPNWSARSVVPMYYSHHYMLTMNYNAIQGFCAQRMNQTEQPDVVATAYLIRERIKEEFPLLAEYLRPAEDWAKKDLTAKVNTFSDIFGVAHSPSGRWPIDMEEFKKKYKIKHLSPCTEIERVEKELKIKIPRPNEWINYVWSTLLKKDKSLFRENGEFYDF